MDLLYSAAEAIYDYMETGPGPVATLIYLAVAGIPVVLLHELGHAWAAARRLDSDVEIRVGSVGKLADLQLGKLRASLHALRLPGQEAGSASFDAAQATARDVLWIALAGPLASLAGVVVTAAALSQAAPGTLRDLLWAATLVGVLGVLNLIPFTYEERRGSAPFQTDGRLALDALRVIRELG